MKPAVEIAFSPSIQMIAALDTVVERTVVDRTPPESPLVDWAARVADVATPFERSDMEHLFYPTSTTIFLFHTVIHEGWHEPATLISGLSAMEGDVFVGHLRKLFQIEEDEAEWVTADRIARALEEDRDRERISFRGEAERLHQLLSNFDAFRSKLIEVLDWFNRRVFSQFIQAERRSVDRWIANHRSTITTHHETALDQLTRGNFDSLLADRNTVRLFPVVNTRADETWLMLPGSDGEVDEAYFIFDTAHANRVLLTSRDDSGFRAVTDEMIEALADAKRIAILRLLRKRPHFSKEIADGIGVSASTASYHIDKLIAARLIHLEISRGRRFYYAINSRGVRGFLARFEAEFLGDE